MNRVAKFITHLIVVFCAFLLAYELRRALPFSWWLESPDALRVLRWGVLYAAIAGVVEILSQTERGAWRFTSAREAVALLRSVTITAVLFVLVIFFVDRGVQLPRSVLPLAWVLSFLLLVGMRLVWRLAHDRSLASSMLPSWFGQGPKAGTPLLIVGDMAEAERHVRHLATDRDSPYWSAAIVTPNAQERGLRLHGVPCVGSPDRLEKVIDSYFRDSKLEPAILFLADPVRSYGLTPERIGELRKAGYKLLRPQSLSDLDGRSVGAEALKEIPLEEFLPRQPVSLNDEPVRALVGGRRVMVTGAGGSIGSEVARQLLHLGCAHLTMVDHSEFHLFEIEREVQGHRSLISRQAILANVRDERRMREVFAIEQPDIVFHAAALKHVDLVERNPAEGVLTNVLGTWNVMRAAIDAGASQFVLISTDKAVAPTNIMGSTKRIAETLLDLVRPKITRLSAVRFGNVLGSAGSVVPIFRDQIARGGPVMVRHPEVDRYFMTIPEAVQLVLHSAAVSATRTDTQPTKYLLEMGEPVRIVDLARQMIQLSGQTPDVDVMIEFSGLKPGEKLTEALFDDGEAVFDCAEGIMELRSAATADPLEIRDIEALIDDARKGDDAQVASAVRRIIERIRAGRRVA